MTLALQCVKSQASFQTQSSLGKGLYFDELLVPSTFEVILDLQSSLTTPQHTLHHQKELRSDYCLLNTIKFPLQDFGHFDIRLID